MIYTMEDISKPVNSEACFAGARDSCLVWSRDSDGTDVLTFVSDDVMSAHMTVAYVLKEGKETRFRNSRCVIDGQPVPSRVDGCVPRGRIVVVSGSGDVFVGSFARTNPPDIMHPTILWSVAVPVHEEER